MNIMNIEIPMKLIIAVVVLVVLVLLPYVLGPFMVRKTLRQSAKPKVKVLPADEDLPKKAAAFFAKVTKALQPLGFEPVQKLSLPEQTPNVQAIVLMFANRKDKVAAIASAVYVKNEDDAKLKTAYVEFSTRFKDGSALLTNNTKELGAFAPRPDVSISRLPSVKEPDRLYRLHQSLEKQEQNGSPKVLRLDTEFKGNAAAYLARSIVEELEAQIDTGYLYQTEDEEAFLPTWKGAFLMTWSQLPPFKNVGQMRRNSREQTILREAGD